MRGERAAAVLLPSPHDPALTHARQVSAPHLPAALLRNSVSGCGEVRRLHPALAFTGIYYFVAVP